MGNADLLVEHNEIRDFNTRGSISTMAVIADAIGRVAPDVDDARLHHREPLRRRRHGRDREAPERRLGLQLIP
jgi:dihydroorotase-like cyclic amidohydrolase